jgi:hypothetical protein
MSTHNAVATVAVRAPLEIIQVPTIRPVGREVRIRMEWTASTPLDLHQNDSGLLVKHPQILGDGVAGTIVEVGDMVRRLAIGDQVSTRKFALHRTCQTDLRKVFGFCFEEAKCKAQQEYVTVAETSLSKVTPKQWRRDNKRADISTASPGIQSSRSGDIAEQRCHGISCCNQGLVIAPRLATTRFTITSSCKLSNSHMGWCFLLWTICVTDFDPLGVQEPAGNGVAFASFISPYYRSSSCI